MTPDWTPWTGGEMPVNGDVVVEVRLRIGHGDDDFAKVFYWNHDPEIPGFDIIAYRIVKQTEGAE